MRFETKAIHIGEEPNLKSGGFGDVVVPIHLASTYARKEIEKPTGGYEYSRTRNPTREALEKKLASLENAKFGLACASGMAAETIVALSLLKSGDHVIAFDDLYGGTKRLFNKILAPQFNISFSYIDLRKMESVSKAIKKNTKLIWIETPTNPLLKLCDIQSISKIANRSNIRLVVDNTFMSPYFQQPLELGADIVVHSTTKYLNGHSDSVGGAIMVSHPTLHAQLKFNQMATGGILSPFDSFLVLRGMKTLAVRMKKHEENALQISEFLQNQPKVKTVHYPGLPTHPQYALAKKQMSGFGGMLSFELKGKFQKAKKFLETLKIFSLGESLGGVESLIEHPGKMTHSALGREEKRKLGITDTLIRVSVGIEDIHDLIHDLINAFQKV